MIEHTAVCDGGSGSGMDECVSCCVVLCVDVAGVRVSVIFFLKKKRRRGGCRKKKELGSGDHKTKTRNGRQNAPTLQPRQLGHFDGWHRVALNVLPSWLVFCQDLANLEYNVLVSCAQERCAISVAVVMLHTR